MTGVHLHLWIHVGSPRRATTQHLPWPRGRGGDIDTRNSSGVQLRNHLHVAGLAGAGLRPDDRDPPDDDGGAFGDRTLVVFVL